MSFIGSKPSQTLATPTSQYFNGTGSQTVFTLNRAVNVAEDLEVFVNNIQQEPGVGKSYTAVGTALTFDAAPSSGTANVYVVYRGLAEVTTRLEHDPNAALAATTGTFSGNVGIGETAPVTPLTITTANKLGSTFTGNINGEGLTVTQTNYTSGNYISLIEAAYDDSSDGNPNVRIGAMFNGNGSNLAFGTSNNYVSGITNAAMFINSSGNVGIGVSDPSQAIDLVGSSNSGSGSVRAGGAGSGTQAAFIAQAQYGSASFGTYASYPAVLNSSNNPMVYFDTNASGRAVFAEGITFNGDTAAANALDDYEEGTWTPTVSTASSHPVQTGIYTKIGNLVTIQCVIQFVQSGTVLGSVSGLPFTVSSVNYTGITFREWYSTGITLSGNLIIGSQSTTGFWNYVNNSAATNGQTYGYGFSVSYRT